MRDSLYLLLTLLPVDCITATDGIEAARELSGLECEDVELDSLISGKYDLPNVRYYTTSHEECRTKCQATPGCTAWAWLSRGQDLCAPKGEGGAEAKRIPYRGVVSGLRECKSKKLI